MKQLQEIILGVDFQSSIAAAVAEAVRKADTAGLPKAYLPDFSLEHETSTGIDDVLGPSGSVTQFE